MGIDSSSPAFESPWQALGQLISQLREIPAEPTALSHANGRVLAQTLLADRSSPPADVSAMDGFAVRADEIQSRRLIIFGESVPGQPRTELPAKAAIRIATGGLIPQGADAVVRVEDADFDEMTVGLKPAARKPRAGDAIRKTGENVPFGAPVLTAGTVLNPASIGTLATFDVFRPVARRPVRVALLTTGDEIVADEQSPKPWQLRNANAAVLLGLLQSHSWVTAVAHRHVPDDPQQIQSAVTELLAQCDVLVLTGGVSRGHKDFVPEMIQSTGGRIIFHRLPLRPGGPVLGAVGPEGQAILGLPGNPVSVLFTACFFLSGVCRSLAGLKPDEQDAVLMRLTNAQAEVQAMRYAAPRRWDFLPVRRVGADKVELILFKSSGDISGLSAADGYLLIPSGPATATQWPYRPFAL